VGVTPWSIASVECRPLIPCAVTIGTPAALQIPRSPSLLSGKAVVKVTIAADEVTKNGEVLDASKHKWQRAILRWVRGGARQGEGGGAGTARGRGQREPQNSEISR